MNGPESLSYPELAKRISRRANWEANYVDISVSAGCESMLDVGIPKWLIDALLERQQDYVAGQGGEVTDVLPGLLGRAPRLFDQFLEEFRGEFSSQSATG